MTAMQAHDGPPPTGTPVPTPSGPPGASSAPRDELDERARRVVLFERRILEDRYDGLLMTLRPGKGRPLVGDTNGLLERLDQVLWDLITGTRRGGLTDDDAELTSELQDIIRERVVRHVLAHPGEGTAEA